MDADERGFDFILSIQNSLNQDLSRRLIRKLNARLYDGSLP